MSTSIKMSLILEFLLLFNIVPYALGSGFRAKDPAYSSREDVSRLLSLPFLKPSEHGNILSESSSTDSYEVPAIYKDSDKHSVHSSSDSASDPTPLQGTDALRSNGTKTNDDSQKYSVGSPFGADGQPLLTGKTNYLRGYKAYPQSNTVVINRPFGVPNRQSEYWDGFNSNHPHPGTQWVSNSLWNSRRSGTGNGIVSQNGVKSPRMNQITQVSEEVKKNQDLARSILTKALDIVTGISSGGEAVCRDEKGLSMSCEPSTRKSSKKPNKKLRRKCRNEQCMNQLSFYDVYWPLLQKIQTSYQSKLNGETRGVVPGTRHGFNQRPGLPPPRTRTVFRSVETSPTSSLARLFNSDDTVGGNGGGGQTSNSARGNNNNNGNAGASSSHNSGDGGTSRDPTPPVGVDPDVFNKFARDVVSFEQQSASEIKRLDNLLRQLAMAAQTDFTSVSNNVNALQQELVQTQQQLVQAWSILNATHVRDNLKTVGDLHGVKTDVYRLHALMTGATPLGQGTAQGRAAEVKEVATIGPGVDCAALYKSGVNTSGVYDLQPQPADNGTRMTAFCDMDTDGGGWTVFQRRRDGSDDFFRGWNSYKHGFGSYRHDHWLGLENIHLLTKYGDNVMRIELTDWDNKTRWAEFSYTRIMDESDGYRILVGGYRGTAGDPFHSLSYSMRMQSMRFSTFDSDNDLDSGGNCALTFTSGWWFNKCFQVNLNGVWYGNSRYAGPSMNGIVWDLWPEHFNGYSLKYTEMKLRPADFLDKK